MEKISEISEYLIFKTDADAFGQWENPMEGVLGSDEMFLLERLRWQAPSAVHQAACVVIKFLETFGARVRVTNFVVRIRMVRTITRAYRRYKQRRTRLIQRLAQVPPRRCVGGARVGPGGRSRPPYHRCYGGRRPCGACGRAPRPSRGVFCSLGRWAGGCSEACGVPATHASGVSRLFFLA